MNAEEQAIVSRLSGLFARISAKNKAKAFDDNVAAVLSMLQQEETKRALDNATSILLSGQKKAPNSWGVIVSITLQIVRDVYSTRSNQRQQDTASKLFQDVLTYCEARGPRLIGPAVNVVFNVLQYICDVVREEAASGAPTPRSSRLMLLLLKTFLPVPAYAELLIKPNEILLDGLVDAVSTLFLSPHFSKPLGANVLEALFSNPHFDISAMQDDGEHFMQKLVVQWSLALQKCEGSADMGWILQPLNALLMHNALDTPEVFRSCWRDVHVHILREAKSRKLLMHGAGTHLMRPLTMLGLDNLYKVLIEKASNAWSARVPSLHITNINLALAHAIADCMVLLHVSSSDDQPKRSKRARHTVWDPMLTQLQRASETPLGFARQDGSTSVIVWLHVLGVTLSKYPTLFPASVLTKLISSVMSIELVGRSNDQPTQRWARKWALVVLPWLVKSWVLVPSRQAGDGIWSEVWRSLVGQNVQDVLVINALFSLLHWDVVPQDEVSSKVQDLNGLLEEPQDKEVTPYRPKGIVAFKMDRVGLVQWVMSKAMTMDPALVSRALQTIVFSGAPTLIPPQASICTPWSERVVKDQRRSEEEHQLEELANQLWPVDTLESPLRAHRSPPIRKEQQHQTANDVPLPQRTLLACNVRDQAVRLAAADPNALCALLRVVGQLPDAPEIQEWAEGALIKLLPTAPLSESIGSAVQSLRMQHEEQWKPIVSMLVERLENQVQHYQSTTTHGLASSSHEELDTTWDEPQEVVSDVEDQSLFVLLKMFLHMSKHLACCDLVVPVVESLLQCCGERKVLTSKDVHVGHLCIQILVMHQASAKLWEYVPRLWFKIGKGPQGLKAFVDQYIAGKVEQSALPPIKRRLACVEGQGWVVEHGLELCEMLSPFPHPMLMECMLRVVWNSEIRSPLIRLRFAQLVCSLAKNGWKHDWFLRNIHEPFVMELVNSEIETSGRIRRYTSLHMPWSPYTELLRSLCNLSEPLEEDTVTLLLVAGRRWKGKNAHLPIPLLVELCARAAIDERWMGCVASVLAAEHTSGEQLLQQALPDILRTWFHRGLSLDRFPCGLVGVQDLPRFLHLYRTTIVPLLIVYTNQHERTEKLEALVRVGGVEEVDCSTAARQMVKDTFGELFALAFPLYYVEDLGICAQELFDDQGFLQLLWSDGGNPQIVRGNLINTHVTSIVEGLLRGIDWNPSPVQAVRDAWNQARVLVGHYSKTTIQRTLEYLSINKYLWKEAPQLQFVVAQLRGDLCKKHYDRAAKALLFLYEQVESDEMSPRSVADFLVTSLRYLRKAPLLEQLVTRIVERDPVACVAHMKALCSVLVPIASPSSLELLQKVIHAISRCRDKHVQAAARDVLDTLPLGGPSDQLQPKTLQGEIRRFALMYDPLRWDDIQTFVLALEKYDPASYVPQEHVSAVVRLLLSSSRTTKDPAVHRWIARGLSWLEPKLGITWDQQEMEHTSRQFVFVSLDSFLLSDDTLLAQSAGCATQLLLQTEVGQVLYFAMLEEHPLLAESLGCYFPEGTPSQGRSSGSLTLSSRRRLPAQRHVTRLHLPFLPSTAFHESVWKSTSLNYSDWIRRLAYALASDQMLRDDRLFACCAALCWQDTEFAGSMAREALHTIVSKPEYHDARIVDLLHRHVLDPSVKDVAIVQWGVELFAYLRRLHALKEQVSKVRSVEEACGWLEWDFLLLGRAALRCGKPSTATMCAELWMFRHPNAPADRRKPLWDIQQQAFAALSEPDAIYALQGGRRRPQREAALREADGAWSRLGVIYEQLLEVDSSSVSWHRGLLRSLRLQGYSTSVEALVAKLGEMKMKDGSDLDELRYEYAWRSGSWFALHPARTPRGFHSAMYLCVRTLLSRGDRALFAEQLEAARAWTLHTLDGVSNREHLHSIIGRLQLLEDVQVVGDDDDVWSSPSDTHRLHAFLEEQRVSWKSINDDFDAMEPLQAMRTVVLRAIDHKSPAYVWQMLSRATDARRSGRVGLAERVLVELDRVVESLDALLPKWEMELAHVEWEQGDCTQAIDTCDSLSQQLQLQDDGSKLLKAESLVQKAVWLATSHSMGARGVAKQFELAITFADDLRPSKDTSRVMGYGLFQFAQFADTQYQHAAKSLRGDDVQAMRRMKEQTEVQIKMLGKDSASKRKANLLQREIDAHTGLLNQWEEDKQTYCKMAISSYVRCLEAVGEYDRKSAFRVCSLLFDDPVLIAPLLLDSVQHIPSHKFLPLVRQLVSRVGPGGSAFARVIHDMVLAMAKTHPFHTVYPLLALSKDANRTVVVNALLEEAGVDGYALLIRDMRQLVKAYIALADVKMDSKDRGKTHALSRQFQKVLHCETGFQRVAVLTATIHVDPTGEYRDVPCVAGFSKSFDVPQGGISHPKILKCLGTDGVPYKQIVKGNDDVRQDAIMEQLCEHVNGLLLGDVETRRRRLQLRTYKIIPLAPMYGLLEFVKSTRAFNHYLVTNTEELRCAHERFHPTDWTYARCYQLMQKAAGQSRERRYRLFCEIMEHFRPVFHHFFLEEYTTPREWFVKRLTYTQSVAVNSMIGHVVDLGDRHGSNILLDTSTGEVVHIDFGVAFGHGKVLITPELVPFRLTRDVVDGMGVYGTKGVFTRSCEETMRVLREHRDSLMTIIGVLLHDPLNKWVKRAKEQKEALRRAETKVEREEDAGQTRASVTLARVEQRLMGMDEHGQVLSVDGQVRSLIAQATNPELWCQMFQGWSAWV